MKSNPLEILLAKFLGNSAKGEDLDELNRYFEDDNYKSFIKSYLKTHFVVLYKMNRPNLEETKKELLREIRRDKKLTLRRNMYRGLRYAAILVCFLAIGIYMFNKADQTVEIKIESKENAITLEHSDGSVEEISETGASSIKSKDGKLIANQIGNKITFNSAEISETVRYNTISVPYGKNITIVLSDSTEVTMNAGSRMTFPEQFVKGKKRKVRLFGEAFFKVSHDSEHPFVVGLDSLDVQVLGTTFNVANYAEDSTAEVVLVSGSVQLVPNVSAEVEKIILAPGFKGTFNKATSRIETVEVPTDLYTSWVNGYIVFRNAPFRNMMQKLERHYNVTISNPDGYLENEKFNATIDIQHESISQVLEYFSRIHNIHFEVDNDHITILKND